MNAHLTPRRWKAVATLALLFVSTGGFAADPVHESFDRMLAHQPVPVATATPTGRDIDPLIAAVSIPLREGVRTTQAPDPVAESFARMLAHTPNPFAPAIPSHAGVDPLTTAMVEPLRRLPAEHVAAARLESGRATAQPR